MRKFIYGPGIDEPICMIDAADNNAVYYYHFDGLGSVIALSNENKQIIERYSYDVFGEPNRTSSLGNPYLFTGRRYDNETGLYYYRARYYDYYTGRFLQPDPIGYDDGVNLYTYCGNNPSNWVDPSGLCKESELAEDSRRQKIERLQRYIRSAEVAMISNMLRMRISLMQIQYIHRSCRRALVGMTGMAAVSIFNTAYMFNRASTIHESGMMAPKAPYPDAWNAQLRLLKMSAAKLASAKRGLAMDVGTFAVAVLSVAGVESRIDIGTARRNIIGKYEPFVDQAVANIEDLSRGVSAAREELRRLGYED